MNLRFPSPGEGGGKEMDWTQKTTVVVSAVGLIASCVMVLRVLRRRRLSLATGTDPLRPHRFTRRRITMSVMLAAVSVLLFLGVGDLGLRHRSGLERIPERLHLVLARRAGTSRVALGSSAF